jgi:hypothetical protein
VTKPVFPPDRPTSVPCPAGCDAGQKVTRIETGTGYRIASLACAYCGGTGVVTPARHAAWNVLSKRRKEKDP